MSNVINIAIFTLVNVIGFYITPVSMNLAVMFDFVPAFETSEAVKEYQLWVMGGGLWACILGAFISLGFFFAEKPWKYWFLLAPVYVTLIYNVIMLFYFSGTGTPPEPAAS